MTKEEVFAGLKEVILVVRPKINLDNVTLDSALVQDLGIDSLSLMLMALASEEKFDMSFEQNRFETVNDVCEYILSVKNK